MGQVAVFSSAGRCRRWSDDQRLAIVSEAFSPGTCITKVAHRRDVSTSLLYDWRTRLPAASWGERGAALRVGGHAGLKRTRLMPSRTEPERLTRKRR